MLDHEMSESTRYPFPAPSYESGAQVEERRGGQRHMSILRVGKLVSTRGEDLCLIRNISSGGLMAKVYTRLDIGQHVLFELRADKQLAGIVRWVRDDCVGIQFEHAIDVAAVLADRDGDERAGDSQRPRAPRLTRPCKATLRIGAHYHRVSVRDVSQGGVKIAVEQELTVGADAIVTMEGFRAVAGVIRWCRDRHAGVAFNQVISYPEMTAWLKDMA